MTYYFRELRNQQEMLQWLRLRYTIYNSTRCAGFLTANEQEIDVDYHDLSAHHYGLFIEEADEQKLIGGLRVIQNKPVLSSIRMLREMGLINEQTVAKKEALPILSYFADDDEVDFAPLLDKTNIATEGSRLVLMKEHQSLRLAKFIIRNAIILHLNKKEDWTAFVSCNPLHARLYRSFGFENVCNKTTWAKDAPVSALYLRKENLSAASREELELMAAEYRADNFTRYVHERKQPVRRTA